MTMNAMLIYLKERGFKATKDYIPEKKLYRFVVANGHGRAITRYFEYPTDCDDRQKENKQRAFLYDIIRTFEKETYIDTDSIREVDSLYPKMFFMPGRCNGKTMTLNAWIKEQLNAIYGAGNKFHTTPNIKDVIFNDPATIVLWADGTKTVVKTQDGDEYDPEKGLAMAISKKALGNKHEYYNVFKKWLKKYEKHRGPKQLEINVPHDFATACRDATENLKKLSKALSKKTSDESKSIMDDPTLKS